MTKCAGNQTCLPSNQRTRLGRHASLLLGEAKLVLTWSGQSALATRGVYLSLCSLGRKLSLVERNARFGRRLSRMNIVISQKDNINSVFPLNNFRDPNSVMHGTEFVWLLTFAIDRTQSLGGQEYECSVPSQFHLMIFITLTYMNGTRLSHRIT